jgi:hypothetical protein
MCHRQHEVIGGRFLRFLTYSAMVFPLLAFGLFIPTQASATVPAAVPEPVSLMLLATGIAGLGAAEMIRRRKNK